MKMRFVLFGLLLVTSHVHGDGDNMMGGMGDAPKTGMGGSGKDTQPKGSGMNKSGSGNNNSQNGGKGGKQGGGNSGSSGKGMGGGKNRPPKEEMTPPYTDLPIATGPTGIPGPDGYTSPPQLVRCGKKMINPNTHICCNGYSHPKAWGDDTRCCNEHAYNPILESCCNGWLVPGYGEGNAYGECCGQASYDSRCYRCDKRKKLVLPTFDFRYQTCCDGQIRRLLPNKTCCCGSTAFDPTNQYCCKGDVKKRPSDVPGDCCNCGLTLVDIGFVLDSSESIDEELEWPKMLDFVEDVLDGAAIDKDQVRVGVITYNHFVMTNIYLDEIHSRSQLFRRVQKIQYEPGSTKTGAAIEVMRTELFDTHAGDRPNVNNVAVIMTDGKSDNFENTVEQARKAKEQGIFMYAIGIGPKVNMTELNNIATPPASRNVKNIGSFDDLEDIRGNVFSAICTGTPIITIYRPCGDDWYNPRSEVCCNGKPQNKVAGDDTVCCYQKSYDKKKQICCDQVVNDRKAGKKTVCCGKYAQHPELELCCDFQPVPMVNSNSKKCCDIYAYDPRTEVCCDGFVFAGYGDIDVDTGCCDEMSYDKRCYDCVDGRIIPLFDPECQMCCDGVIRNMTLGLSCCCGQDIFKPDDQICCNNVLRKRKASDGEFCCECSNALVDIGIVLDSSESIGIDNWELLKSFLVDLVDRSDIDTGETRFGLVTYHHEPTLEFYLNTYLRSPNMIAYLKSMEYDPGSTLTGKGLETMRNSLFVPRNGDRKGVPNVGLVITDGRSHDREHTREQARLAKLEGIHIYVVGVGLTATQELKDIASEPWEENVFTSKNFKDLQALEGGLFKALSYNCPQEPKKKLKNPCGKKMYDPRTEVCCQGNPQPKYGSDQNTKCCGKKSYNFREQMCCKEKIGKRPHPTRSQCCDNKPYDPRFSVCCYDKNVIPKDGPQATECCGLETYNPAQTLCCDGILYPNYGPGGCCGACCLLNTNGPVSYDTRCYKCEFGELWPLYDCAYERCCDGVIQNITSEMTCCCGKKAFDPTDEICCDTKLRPRTDADEEDCCECTRNIIDICFVLDSSESVGFENWVLMEKFVEDVINSSDLTQARFAMVTFRHDVTVEFLLNSFSDKDELLDRVNNLKYERGSTRTDLGLEAMRKEIFTPGAGDRASAPNYAIVITDGESRYPELTAEQAELAKKKGVHIVAIGVGLTADGKEELENMASKPPSENAFSIDNFKELQKKKEDIFSDMSEAICPQYPKTRCKVPCGDDFIDETMQICCDEVPGVRMAGDMTKCCDMVAYDPDCFMCCEGNLVSKYAGEYTECCCRIAYDSRYQVCCGNEVLPKKGPGNFTGCCYLTAYDMSTEVCCDLVNIQPSYGADRTGCCGAKSYNMYCDECKGDKNIVPRYDTKTHVCCAGDIQEKQFGERSCCCGNKQFDADLDICCDDNLNSRPRKGEVVCCAKKAYDPKTGICCDGKVNPRVNGYETLCCGTKSFHPDNFFCCNDKLNKKTSEDDNCCCDKTVFDVNTQVCCEGSVYPLVTAGNRDSTTCCGNKAFDPSTHLCCERTVRPLTEGTSTICCGNKAYNSDTSVCEFGKVKPRKGLCQGRKYDLDSQMCCNGWVNNMTSGMNAYTRCCFDRAYDTREYVCCCNGFLQPAFAGVNTQCCYSFGYDASTHICCDGQVIEKKVPSADCCCERESYDSKREICCGGVVKSRCVGLFTKCCGTEAYDPGYMICCGGKLFNRSYGHDTYCCGDEIYTPLLAACCGNKIAYTRKLKMEW